MTERVGQRMFSCLSFNLQYIGLSVHFVEYCDTEFMYLVAYFVLLEMAYAKQNLQRKSLQLKIANRNLGSVREI